MRPTQRLCIVLVTTVIVLTSTNLILNTWWSNSGVSALRDSSAKQDAIITYPRCAPWIPPDQRVVAFDKSKWSQTWHTYHTNKRVYHGGEAYWAASLDYVLQQLGFRVVRRKMDVSLLKDMSNNKIFKFIINSNGPDNYPKSVRESPLFQNSNITCRIHFLHWWAGNLKYNANATGEPETYNPFPSDPLAIGYDPRHALAPLPGSINVPIQYFVHSQVTLPPITHAVEHKPRAGFLLSKHCRFDVTVVRVLLNAGFTLHTTCFDKVEQQKLENELDDKGSSFNRSLLIHHRRLLPIDFSRLMREMAFIVGFGDPLDSPSPYEALANGAAYLQKKCHCPGTCRVGSIQHRSLRNLGFPYVHDYHRDCNDTKTGTSVVESAERAYNNPFPPYVPFQHSLGTVLSQVCNNLIESNAVCACAQLQERIGTDTEENLQRIRECRSGSFYEFPL